MSEISATATDAARRVLRLEGEAVLSLSDNLPDDFQAIVELIRGAEGRVIVSGVGKSGHIGRKIAATLASTGTPAYFVHATEASHGDLGMVTRHDILLLISNSGETTELRDMVYHSQRFSIPLIGLSSNPDSTLMRAADYRLTLPRLPEACSIGMAPTTSTTLTLALGDALAVALMESRSFKAEDFGVFHPGGKLGSQMRTVADLMHQGDEIPILTGDAAVQDALLVMTSKGFGLAAMVDAEGVLTGVISDGDLRRNMDGLLDRKPFEIANRTPVTAPPGMLAPEALALLNTYKIGALIVVDDERRPIGVLHIHDLLRAGVA
ncbi:KpsF/GutQ family sugar-phosphate isomerase [Jannaschia aquimarina]|uniref:KdsD protein n=1 Tax=Jannaschia aquimarina TaxID=935700 RepID=A0A0D1D6K9_9RHOB|nr:KpsF/GutQ family sugar-phosphate isomerase [Jannaschia aquimarina]KIT15613.1 Arabinose 5-phosphate isomerase KdsD [Jannaschia aquimarina]SNT27725.1 arabinose-5-phosphate isomerase [Jannaschia aquimarina]